MQVRPSDAAGRYGRGVAKPVDPGQLVGATEIAERLGVARPQVIHTWRTRHADFPEPVLALSQGLIWYWPDVEKWARRTGRIK